MRVVWGGRREGCGFRAVLSGPGAPGWGRGEVRAQGNWGWGSLSTVVIPD